MVDIDLISVWRIDFDLISVLGSEFICFVSGGRKRLGVSIWIEIDLDFVWWSTANRYGVSTYRCVGYVLEDHSVIVNGIAQWFILCKRTKEVRASNSSQGDWVSSSVVHPSQTNRVPGSKPHRSRKSFFFWNVFSEIHLHTTARPKQNPLNNRSTS